MKIQFAILWLLLLIPLSTFVALGQNAQATEPLKPNEILTNNDNGVTNSYRDLGEEWSLTKKSNDRGGDKQTLFHRIRNRNKTQKAKSNSSNSKYKAQYFEMQIGILRTLTSNGDYGNLYFAGLGFSIISDRIDLSIAVLSVGWGKLKDDIPYYHETWEAGSKTLGVSFLNFDFGYNISPIENIRFSPLIGCTFVTSLAPRSKDKDKYPGLEKYTVTEFLIFQVGFDTYHFKPDRNFIKLKYRYTPNASLLRDEFIKDDDKNINKHIITLGINLFIEKEIK